MDILRTIALICFFGPLAAMLFEPFFEQLLDWVEWDTEDFAVPFVMWVSENLYILVGAMGLGAGVWLHYFASKLDARNRPQPDGNLLKLDGEKDIDFEVFHMKDQFHYVIDRTFRNEKIQIDGKFFKGCTFHSVTLEYNASKPFGISDCTFYGFHISTRNRYAERMIGLLHGVGWISTPAFDGADVITPKVWPGEEKSNGDGNDPNRR